MPPTNATAWGAVVGPSVTASNRATPRVSAGGRREPAGNGGRLKIDRLRRRANRPQRCHDGMTPRRNQTQVPANGYHTVSDPRRVSATLTQQCSAIPTRLDRPKRGFLTTGISMNRGVDKRKRPTTTTAPTTTIQEEISTRCLFANGATSFWAGEKTAGPP